MIELDIRAERPGDVGAVRALVRAAFGEDSDTPDFVEDVRAQAQVCLAEVAVVEGAIVGHSQWCDAPLIVGATVTRAAYLSCLSADPALQRRGIGSALVRSGLKRLSAGGYAAATLLGDPAYYGRFGFSWALAERIEAPHRSQGRGFQAIELVAGALGAASVGSDFPAVIAPTGPAPDTL